MPCTTSRSMGLFWQGWQQWMGIITVSLQQELAEMKAVFNIQKSLCNYLKAKGRDRDKERRWNESRWEARRTSFQVVYYIWRDQLWERLSVCHVWRNSQGWGWSELQDIFTETNLHLTQLWPTYPTFWPIQYVLYDVKWQQMLNLSLARPGP